jgi:hypothetical protein
MIRPEDLAPELCYIISDSTLSSYEAARKIYEHLENNYRDQTVLFSYHVNTLSEFVKSYRFGDTLSNVIQKIIDLVAIPESNSTFLESSESGNQLTIGNILGNLGNLTNLPPSVTSTYFPTNVGTIDLTANAKYAPDPAKWFECDGKMIDSLVHQDLYNFIQADIPGFDAYVNGFLQVSGSPTTYSFFSTFSGNMQMLFNLPIIKDYSIKVLS